MKISLWKSQSIIYVKEYLIGFSLPSKILYKNKAKQILELAKTQSFAPEYTNRIQGYTEGFRQF